MDERDLLPASIRSGANFNVYLQYSRIEDRVASLKDFCRASTKRLLHKLITNLLHKYKSKAYDTLNLHAKLTTKQLVCNYTNKLSY